jgi:hypothetical protein
MAMQFNKCDHCGAGDGRAGNCFGTEGQEEMYCANCVDTMRSGDVVFHANLRRTDEEIAKTRELVKTETFAQKIMLAIDSGVEVDDICDAFGVNQSTIKRWGLGKSEPQPYVQPMILEVITNL